MSLTSQAGCGIGCALESGGVDDVEQHARVGFCESHALPRREIFKRGLVRRLAFPDVLENVLHLVVLRIQAGYLESCQRFAESFVQFLGPISTPTTWAPL